jgi:hypothetical protein
LLLSLGLLLQQLLLTKLLTLLDQLRLRQAFGGARVVEWVLVLLLLLLLLWSVSLLLLLLLLPLLLLKGMLLLLRLLVCGRRLHPLHKWPRLSTLQRRGRALIFFIFRINHLHRVALRLLLLPSLSLSLVALILLQRRLLLDALGAASRCRHYRQGLLRRMLALQGVRGWMPLLL